MKWEALKKIARRIFERLGKIDNQLGVICDRFHNDHNKMMQVLLDIRYGREQVEEAQIRKWQQEGYEAALRLRAAENDPS